MVYHQAPQIESQPVATLDVEQMVTQPTWRELLLELVNSNQIDPWNVDIILIADKYLEKVKELATIDLRLPANIILATSLLLRFKSDALSLEETRVEDGIGFEEELGPRQLIAEDIPALVTRMNKPRERKITLQELMAAVEQLVNSTDSKQLMLPIPKTLELQLPLETLHELIQKMYAVANELKDEKGELKFSSLLDPAKLREDTGHHVTTRLMPVLHLVQERKVDISQEKPFTEITIKVL